MLLFFLVPSLFFSQFSPSLIFQCCYQKLTPWAWAWSALAHGIRTTAIGGSLCMCQVVLKLDELICLLHGRSCHVTITHTYIEMTMFKDISCRFSVYLLFIQITATEFILNSKKSLHSRNRHPSTRGQNCGSACYQVTEWAKYTIDWGFFFCLFVWGPLLLPLIILPFTLPYKVCQSCGKLVIKPFQIWWKHLNSPYFKVQGSFIYHSTTQCCALKRKLWVSQPEERSSFVVWWYG